MPESTQQKLSRVRKPRVHITYEVETEGGVEVKELPFVVGVLGDFAGDPTEPLKPMRDRKFIQIDRDNFDQVMDRVKPGLNFKVDNVLSDSDEEISVNLKFSSMKDFDPAAVAQQVEPLRRLMETRNKLRDLASRADRSDELEGKLSDILKNEDALSGLSPDEGAEKSE